jgi:hypothetical protein
MKQHSANIPFPRALFSGLALFGLVTSLNARQAAHSVEPAPAPDAQIAFNWLAFPDSTKFKVLGLYWFDENKPQLWRLPKAQYDELPKGVQRGCKQTSGGRILLKCDSSSLGLKILPLNNGSLRFLDVYINGKYHGSAGTRERDVEANIVLFRGLDKKEKEIVIYLPFRQEILVKAIGVDEGTKFSPPEHKFATPLPIVFYGSSVCQGNGAQRAGMTYEAILARDLNLDFVNLGFGGAGKAEENVVKLVSAIPACCYVFDLGKSYGTQDLTPYKLMLQAIRKSHPDAPIICMTPITSVREVQDQAYSKRSVHDRTVMRDAVNEFTKSGGQHITLLEGEDLLGFKEHDGLSKDGVHPKDEGYTLIAGKLAPIIRKTVLTRY